MALAPITVPKLRGASVQLHQQIEAWMTNVKAHVDALEANQLPAVTSADNGKILKVAGGVWTVGTDAT